MKKSKFLFIAILLFISCIKVNALEHYTVYNEQSLIELNNQQNNITKLVPAVNDDNDSSDNDLHNDTTVENICSQPYYRKPMKFIGTFITFAKIIVPIIIIIFGLMDLYKAITSQKDDGITKAVRSIVVRVLAGVFIFFLPGIVQFILNMVNEWSNYKNNWCCCTECILNSDCDTNSCNSSSCKIGG